MTTLTATVPARARDVLAAEWIKLRSVRSNYLVLAFAAAAALIIGYLAPISGSSCTKRSQADQIECT